MDSIRRSTRIRKCVDYNNKCALPTDDVEVLESPSGSKQKRKTQDDENSLQGSPSRASIQKMPHIVENEASPELVQTRKKKKLSLGKKESNKDNKEKELEEKSEETPTFEGVQEMNMVVITDPTPTNVTIKNGAEDDDLFDGGELSDPSAKSEDDSDDDQFVFDVSDDASDYEESSKSKSKKKSPNTGRKTKSTSTKENGGIKKSRGKKQTESTASAINTSEPSNKKTASSLLSKKTIGGLKKKAIGESIPSTPKFASGKYTKKSVKS
ncbi:9267_t:CDS:2 [Funneliformis geosporum]|uniref:8361_t:CDS:1 n=1 Tax=Funneliformis geosporum TaxID=1117311 RepID=A0A9W4WJ38_9GLOM|nr:8361_t:CDS:2 [Funneliformis geosporum]CAI2165923.1 9267_t:CDS:2 [Funneliformis geosporum]